MLLLLLLLLVVVVLHRLHRSSIPPSERMEKTRSGYVIPPQAGGEAHGRERDSGEEEVEEEGGRFPAQYSLFSHFSMDTMYGIWSCFFRGADTQMDAAVSSIFCAHVSSMKSVFSFSFCCWTHSSQRGGVFLFFVVVVFFVVFFFSFFFFFFFCSITLVRLCTYSEVDKNKTCRFKASGLWHGTARYGTGMNARRSIQFLAGTLCDLMTEQVGPISITPQVPIKRLDGELHLHAA